jgi:hypothetical protein
MATYRDRLLSAQANLGVSNREMALLLMTPRQTYDQWVGGRRRVPGVAVVAAEGVRDADPKRTVRTVGIDDAKLLRLADGTRSITAIARVMGVTKQAVSVGFGRLRKAGHQPKHPGRRGRRPTVVEAIRL